MNDSVLDSGTMPIIKPLNGLFLKYMSLPQTELLLERVLKMVQSESGTIDDHNTLSIQTSHRLLEVGEQHDTLEVPRSPSSTGRFRGKHRSPRAGRDHSRSRSRSKSRATTRKPLQTPERSCKIQRFFFAEGAPVSPQSTQREKRMISEAFDAKNKPQGLSVDDFFPITMRICEFSSYCNSLLFTRVLSFNSAEFKQGDVPTITEDMFLRYWDKNIANLAHHTRFFRLVRATEYMNYLTRQDFVPIVQEIVDRHPGLEFLEATPKFQLRYAQTVIARIFYQVNRSGNEKLTLNELKKSNFLLTLGLLDEQDDINKINDYFSYEHFYVIYCKFWELDTDHDSLLDASDLLRYEDYSLTAKIVNRIMDGYPRRLRSGVPGKMSYEDFIVFLISEVDKTSETSIDYWFKAVDIDGDGDIQAHEVKYFFTEQKQRMQALSQEEVHFIDVLCQLVDMIKPEEDDKFRKKDIMRSRLGGLFFNILFNMNKYLIAEQRDPIRTKQIHATPQLTDWDRYAIAGYFALAECDPDDDPEDMGDDLEEWQGQDDFGDMDDLQGMDGHYQEPYHEDEEEGWGHDDPNS